MLPRVAKKEGGGFQVSPFLHILYCVLTVELSVLLSWGGCSLWAFCGVLVGLQLLRAGYEVFVIKRGVCLCYCLCALLSFGCSFFTNAMNKVQKKEKRKKNYGDTPSSTATVNAQDSNDIFPADIDFVFSLKAKNIITFCSSEPHSKTVCSRGHQHVSHTFSYRPQWCWMVTVSYASLLKDDHVSREISFLCGFLLIHPMQSMGVHPLCITSLRTTYSSN